MEIVRVINMFVVFLKGFGSRASLIESAASTALSTARDLQWSAPSLSSAFRAVARALASSQLDHGFQIPCVALVSPSAIPSWTTSADGKSLYPHSEMLKLWILIFFSFCSFNVLKSIFKRSSLSSFSNALRSFSTSNVVIIAI